MKTLALSSRKPLLQVSRKPRPDELACLLGQNTQQTQQPKRGGGCIVAIVTEPRQCYLFNSIGKGIGNFEYE